MRSSKFLFVAASFSLNAFFSTAALAQIKTDGSVGSDAQSLSAVGGQFTIPQTLGRLSGSNLFHSFKDFNINTGESATFTTSSTGISNVISRVTGGNVSNINGTLALRAAEGAPAFWFINPAGVAFGQGASIDVPGAFHVSTAHYLKFPDGKFYSDTQNVSTFSSAPPEAFGFLGTTRASIEVTAGAKLNNGDNTLNLIAGDITIDGSEVLNAAGAMNLVAMGTAVGEVTVNSAAPLAAAGKVKIVNGAQVGSETLNDSQAGNLNVAAGTLIVDSSVMSSKTQGNGNAGSVQILATDSMNVLNESYVGSKSTGAGNAGDVSVSAGKLMIENQSGLAGEISGSGHGGTISVQVAGDFKILNYSYLSSTSLSALEGYGGNAGDVSVRAGNLLVDKSYIISDTLGSGHAGVVNIQVAGLLEVLSGAQISSSTIGTGKAGNISVTSGSLQIDAKGVDMRLTGIFSNAFYDESVSTIPSSDAGTVNIRVAGDLSLLNGSTISSSTYSPQSKAGSVNINAGTIVLDGSQITSETYGSGPAGTVSVKVASDMDVLNGGNISSTTFSFGEAGSINLNVVGALRVLSGGEVISATFHAGNAGNVNVEAGKLLIDSKKVEQLATGIFSPSVFVEGFSPNNTGDAGKVKIQVLGELSILNGGGILTSTFSPQGKAGSITVNASKILLESLAKIQDAPWESEIASAAHTGSSGMTGSVLVTATDTITVENGGVISLRNAATVTNPQTNVPTTLSVTAPHIFLNNGGQITTESTGNVAANNITLNFTDKLSIHQRSAVTTSSVDGNGGAIDISGKGLLLIDRANITTSVTGASGNAGSIKMGAKTLLMTNGFIQANTSAPLASGGTIQIGAEALVSSFGTLYVGGSTPYAFDAVKPGFNVIQAASPTGVSGNIAITTPNLDLAGKLAGLKVNLLESGGFSRNPCVGSGASSFAVTGRGGLPVSSFGALASSSVKIDTQNAIQVEPFNFAPPQTTLASAQLGCRRS
jgi:filamentous hemagglutinin family protein